MTYFLPTTITCQVLTRRTRDSRCSTPWKRSDFPGHKNPMPLNQTTCNIRGQLAAVNPRLDSDLRRPLTMLHAPANYSDYSDSACDRPVGQADVKYLVARCRQSEAPLRARRASWFLSSAGASPSSVTQVTSSAERTVGASGCTYALKVSKSSVC